MPLRLSSLGHSLRFWLRVWLRPPNAALLSSNHRRSCHIYFPWIYHRSGQCDRRGRATTDAVLKAQGTSAFVVATPTQAPDQQAGGVWARGVGGNLLTSVPVTGSSSVSAPLLLGGVTGASTIDCQSRVREGFDGVQVGADVARLNFGGSGGTFHVGITSGQVETSALTNSSSTNLDFQVPFFGLYSSLTYGNFFADAQIRGNFLEGSLTDSQNAVFFGEKSTGAVLL